MNKNLISLLRQCVDLASAPLSEGDPQGDRRGDGDEGADPLRRRDTEDLPQRGTAR